MSTRITEPTTYSVGTTTSYLDEPIEIVGARMVMVGFQAGDELVAGVVTLRIGTGVDLALSVPAGNMLPLSPYLGCKGCMPDLYVNGKAAEGTPKLSIVVM